MAMPVVLARPDVPERRLTPVRRPVAAAPLAHRVPARLVLPVVVTARKREAILGPDDLRADLKARGLERGLHRASVPPGMPAIRYVAREERPRLEPVCAIVV